MPTYPNNLKLARELRGLSQEDVAEQIGILRSKVSKLETGYAKGSYKEWVALAGLLGFSAKVLMGDEPLDPDAPNGESAMRERFHQIVRSGSSQAIRLKAIAALGELPHADRSADFLMEIASTDEDGDVQDAALEALRAIAVGVLGDVE